MAIRVTSSIPSSCVSRALQELRRKLRRLGYEVLRQAGGSHEIWWLPDTDLRTVIPSHPSKEVPPGILRAILRDLELTLDDLVTKR